MVRQQGKHRPEYNDRHRECHGAAHPVLKGFTEAEVLPDNQEINMQCTGDNDVYLCQHLSEPRVR